MVPLISPFTATTAVKGESKDTFSIGPKVYTAVSGTANVSDLPILVIGKQGAGECL